MEGDPGSDQMILDTGAQPIKDIKPEVSLQAQVSHMNDDQVRSWKGWAELENDPDIFTTVVREWGVQDVRVNDLYDLSMIINRPTSETLGLIFLSKYTPPEENDATPPPSAETTSQPWFANQISRFSCGSVALMNIIMNAENLTLGTILTEFRNKTVSFTPKERGIELDDRPCFRDVHNSFSTKLDRLIVDLSLKEDFQAAKQKSQRAKRKKGKRRKKKLEDDEESGFHFVAYVPAHGAVWKLDGVELNPRLLGDLKQQDITWTEVAITDIQQQMEGAQENGFNFSLMDVTRGDQLSRPEGGIDPQRVREDWAPFIEHMIRLHADKGDLASLLGL